MKIVARARVNKTIHTFRILEIGADQITTTAAKSVMAGTKKPLFTRKLISKQLKNMLTKTNQQSNITEMKC